MITVTKIRIYPNTIQQEVLSQAFGCSRWLWNHYLVETQRVYKETGKGLSRFALNSLLPDLKKEHPWLAKTYSQSLQAVCLNLSRAYINFFEKRARFPRYKSKHGKQTLHYPQNVRIEDDMIYLPKIGCIKAVVHREIVGKLKTVTISRTQTGRYFASLLTDDGVTAPEVSFQGKVLGIDVGLTHLAITSDRLKIENPHFLIKAEKNLKRKQRKLSRKVKGGNTRNKARLLVAGAYERVANTRKDFLHKLSHRLVNENQVIAVEDLNIRGMIKNHCLAQSISDVGWNTLTSFLCYKAARAGKGFIKVNRFFPSSKTCSCCLHVQKEMPLTIRLWRCSECGVLHDRDTNAALNIRREAQRIIAAGIAGTANRGSVRRVISRKSSLSAGAVEVGSHGALARW